MAVVLLGTAGKVGDGQSSTAGTTLAVVNTTGSIIPAGSFIHVCGTWDNIASAAAPTITCSNVGGIGPSTNHATAVGSGVTTTAGSGIWHQCFRAQTLTAIASGATICTLTSNQSAVKRVAVAFAASGCLATLRGTVVTATSTGGNPSAVSGGTAPVSGDLVIGSIAGENNAASVADSDTLNGSWSSPIASIATSGGAANTNVSIGAQGKVVTAGGAQTYNAVSANDAVGCIYAVLPEPAPTLTQAAYRLYADGTETGSTALAAQNTGYTADLTGGNVNLLVRVLLQSTNATATQGGDDFQLQWEKNASGSWTNVTAAGATVSGFDSTNLTEGGATTNRLTGGTGTFNPGRISEDGLADNSGGTPGTGFNEMLYAITLKAADLTGGDVLRFRITDTNTEPVFTYTQTPTITASFGPPPSTPNPPSAVAVNAESLTITGDALPAGATRNDLYRSIDGAAYTLADTPFTLAENFIDTAANDPTKTYTYKTRAVNVGGTTDSTATTGKSPDPSSPSFTLVGGAGTVDISVTRRPYAAKYKVYRRLTGGGSYTIVHTSTTQVASGTYAWQDTGLTVGTSYDYVVSTEAQTPTIRESAQSSAQAVTPINYYTLVPNSTLSQGSWTAIGAATLWDAIDEPPEIGQEGDYMQAPVAGGSACTVTLGSGLPPLLTGGIPTTAKLTYLGDKFGADVTVDVMEGATVRATFASIAMNISSIAELTLTAPQVASITDWTNVRLRFTTVGTNTDHLYIHAMRINGEYVPAVAATARPKTVLINPTIATLSRSARR